MVRKKIVVLGGGSAGWLAALFLKKNWNNLDVSVVEDPNLQPIIAGESCTIPFVDLLEFLEIPIDVWSKEVGAIPKLGSSEEDTYNKKYNSMIIDIIDFINLHYINSRRDSNFWQDQTHRLMPESLAYKLKEWQNGNILFDENPVYSFENYAAVLQGNKIINFKILKEKLKYKRNNILDSIHQEYRRLVLETELMTNNCLHISQWRKND